MKYSRKFYTKVICFLFTAGLSVACTEDIVEPDKRGMDEQSATTPRAIGDWINFNSSSNKPYTQTLVENDFGPLVLKGDWKQNQAYIINNTLKVTMLKNQDSEGGLIAKFFVEKRPSYEVTFKLKFYNDFDFNKGGKLGFGFGFGDVSTGGDSVAKEGNGGSVRMMWNRTNSGQHIFKPYIYHYDMPATYGDNLGAAVFPASGTLVHNRWYTIKIRVKSNTNSSKNGEVKVKVDGITILDRNDVRFAINTNKRWVSQLLFQTFRGGNDNTWHSQKDDHIYYDDIKVTKDPTTAF
jgi:hypothetical protein